MIAKSVGDSASSQQSDIPIAINVSPASAEERYFLEGPRSRRSEFFMTLRVVRDLSFTKHKL